MVCIRYIIVNIVHKGNTIMMMIMVMMMIIIIIIIIIIMYFGPGWLSCYGDSLRAGRSGDRFPVEARFSAPVQIASFTMGTASLPVVKSGRGVTLTPHPLLVPWSRKSRAIPLLPLWAVQPVQSLSACTEVHFPFSLC